jgi:hypothetical protein
LVSLYLQTSCSLIPLEHLEEVRVTGNMIMVVTIGVETMIVTEMKAMTVDAGIVTEAEVILEDV